MSFTTLTSPAQSRRRLAWLVAAALLAGLAAAAPSAQDLTFRLLNIERRLDQLQSRVDWVERQQQHQTLAPAAAPAVSPESFLELQRQQLALNQQMVLMQRQMLEMQKTIDRLANTVAEAEKKERPKESGDKPKPESDKAKPPARRPQS